MYSIVYVHVHLYIVIFSLCRDVSPHCIYINVSFIVFIIIIKYRNGFYCIELYVKLKVSGCTRAIPALLQRRNNESGKNVYIYIYANT